MPQNEINVAIIGCGRIAGHHCRYIHETEGANLVAVCDLVEEKAAAYSKDYGVPAFTNYHEMLRKIPEISMVVIATPSGMHFEHAVEIMNLYRKDVVVEKPTFMRLSQLDEAYDVAQTLGLKIFPVFQNRYNKAVRRVVTALNNNELGAIRIMAVRVRWCRPQRYYDLSPWRGTYAQDGGCLTNQGVHHIDLLRYLGGDVVKVNASMRTLGAKIEVEDAVVATMHYSSNAIGVLEVTTSARPDDFEASISLVCENGLAQLGGIAVNELQIFTPEPAACAASSEDFSRNVYGHGHGMFYQDVVADKRGLKPFPVSQSECRSTIQLLHAFYRSDEVKDWIEVASLGESSRLGVPDEKLADLYRIAKPY